MDNRPRSREKNITSGGSGARRRGSGLGTGPVGSQNGYSGKSGGKVGKKAAVGGGIGLPALVIIGVIAYKLFTGGGSGFSDLLENNSGGYSDFSGGSGGSSYSTSYSSVDNSVAAGSRSKRTNILGNGADQVTLMVYMCGTDLESKHGMASSDIQEMAGAKFGDNVNLLIYTGGCSGWKINGISSSVNQIYKIENGKLKCIEQDMGNAAMTDPSTLSSFIQYCSKNYPANRNELILWDHGGGSVSGYGYDEKNKSSGSMDLAKLDTALSNGGVIFDFIGFDACLMATAETAFLTEKYADYLIASEETEPGIGWYYTNWLNQLGSNTSVTTLELGKTIVDDFVSTCDKKCRGQKTTLSVIDLAEFANTVPGAMREFAVSVSDKLAAKDYKSVSDARYKTREFAQSSKIDQVDLVNLAENIGTVQALELAEAVKGSVKYNKTSSDITNAYGVSIYFPYKRLSNVDSACRAYDKIGMDSEYSRCIKQFASMETSGQIAAGGSSSPVSSILGNFGTSDGSDILSSLVSGAAGSLVDGLMNNLTGNIISGLDLSNISFMKEMPLSDKEAGDYLSANFFDSSNLIWDNSGDKHILTMPESQWSLVHSLDKNLFYDDGQGYLDMGLDNVFEFDADGNLVADSDKTWLSINGQPVAYYHTDTTELGGDRYSISGYVPAYLNGDRVNLIIIFDNDNKYGYIAGAVYDYKDEQISVEAKNMTELNTGDELDFVCDFYSYDGEYIDSYYLGEKMTVSDNMKISNTVVGDGEVKITYKFTDIYNQEYWTDSFTVK